MVKSLDEQIEKLQERQEKLRKRENELLAQRKERDRKARTKRLIEVGAMAEAAAGFEGDDADSKERIARLTLLGKLVEDMCSTGVMGNYADRDDLERVVTAVFQGHDVKVASGWMSLGDFVYEAFSAEWAKRDGEAAPVVPAAPPAQPDPWAGQDQQRTTTA